MIEQKKKDKFGHLRTFCLIVCDNCAQTFWKEKRYVGKSNYCHYKCFNEKRIKISNSKRRNPILGKDMCDYGCGQVAHYIFRNGKICCSKNVACCPQINSTRKIIYGRKPRLGIPPPTKGKTYEQYFGIKKAKKMKNNIRLKNMGKSSIKKLSPEQLKIFKEKQRNNILQRYATGWMPVAGRCNKIKYNSVIAGEVWLDGSWELITANALDKCNIKWQRNKNRFKYKHLNGKIAHYTPDFYLIESQTYVEIKGYETDLDRCKWKQFPNKLIVWKKQEIDKIKQGELYTLIRELK